MCAQQVVEESTAVITIFCLIRRELLWTLLGRNNICFRDYIHLIICLDTGWTDFIGNYLFISLLFVWYLIWSIWRFFLYCCNSQYLISSVLCLDLYIIEVKLCIEDCDWFSVYNTIVLTTSSWSPLRDIGVHEFWKGKALTI